MGRKIRKAKKEPRRKEVAYQNKDITSKVLAERFKGKTFRAYGLELPGIRRVGPTNIPAVRANELRLDNLFELEDGTVAIVDYESEYDEADKVKYLNYLAGIASRYQQEKRGCPTLRMVIIYTCDVRRGQVSAEYNIGAVRVRTETAFLSELDRDGICQRLERKVERNQSLSDQELMESIILPLSYPGKEGKRRKAQEMVRLAGKIQDREQQVFVLAGILVFADKILDRATAERIRKEISMNQVERMIWEEFEEESRQKLEQTVREYEEEKQQFTKKLEEERQRNEEKQQQIVYRMIEKGETTSDIISIIPEYAYDVVEAMRRKWEEDRYCIQ